MGVCYYCTRIWNCHIVHLCFISHCEVSVSEMLAAHILFLQFSGMLCFAGHAQSLCPQLCPALQWNHKLKNETSDGRLIRCWYKQLGQLLQPVGWASVQYVYNGNLSLLFFMFILDCLAPVCFSVYRNLRNSAAFSALHLFGNMFC